MDINKELRDWAARTIEVYKKQSTEIGFYTQTPLTSFLEDNVHEPDLLILGINPGSGGGIKNNTGMELLKGNPCFEGMDSKGIIDNMSEGIDNNKNRKGWALWHRLNNMLKYSNNEEHKNLLRDLDRFVLSNMIFFGTEKEKQIPNIKREECAKQTMKLISLLRPKVVILLGNQSRKLFDKISESKLKVLVPNSMYHCMYGKSHILAIKHTAYYYSNEEMAVVGKTIGYVLDNHDGTINKETIDASYIKEDIIRFEERLKMIQSKRKKKTDIQSNKEDRKDLKERTRLLKAMIAKNGAIQRIYSGTVLFHEYFTTVVDGRYVDSKDKIAIDLMPDEDRKQYSVLVFTRQYDETKTKGLINGIWPNEEYRPWYKDSSRHVHEVISFEVSNDEIKSKMEKVLQEVKAYRNKEYPQR